MATDPASAQDSKSPLTWYDFSRLAGALAARVRALSQTFDGVYGVPRGGVPVAMRVAALLDLPLIDCEPSETTLVVDDIIDSGKTAQHIQARGMHFEALVSKIPWGDTPLVSGWVVFPWERRDEGDGPTDAVRRLLQFLGEDPDREGLQRTPARVVKALKEMTAGYGEDPVAILSTTFTDSCDEMVVLRDIGFKSMCEHHMLPFTGVAHVGYIPAGRVIGLSKLARLVDCFARRLQIQERLTGQVAHAIMDTLQPMGAACIIEAQHSCMMCRGVKKDNAVMITSSLLGSLREDARARAEFLALCGKGHL